MVKFKSLCTLTALSFSLLWIPSLAAAIVPRDSNVVPAHHQLPNQTVLPDDDPFYSPPLGYENTKPGDVLRYRLVPRPITIDNKKEIRPKEAWQILYRTQTSMGDPTATVVTLLVPHKAKPNQLFSLAFFSVSIDSLSALIDLGHTR
jgi:hypothetical protein